MAERNLLDDGIGRYLGITPCWGPLAALSIRVFLLYHLSSTRGPNYTRKHQGLLHSFTQPIDLDGKCDHDS